MHNGLSKFICLKISKKCIFDVHKLYFYTMKTFLSIVLGFFILGTAIAQEANTYFKPLKYRNIGPFRGGRSNSSSGVVNDPLTYYMGTTGGGLWKTQDAGQRWENISDGFLKLVQLVL